MIKNEHFHRIFRKRLVFEPIALMLFRKKKDVNTSTLRPAHHTLLALVALESSSPSNLFFISFFLFHLYVYYFIFQTLSLPFPLLATHTYHQRYFEKFTLCSLIVAAAVAAAAATVFLLQTFSPSLPAKLTLSPPLYNTCVSTARLNFGIIFKKLNSAAVMAAFLNTYN